MGGRERVAARSQTRCTDGVAIKRPSPSSAIASPQAHSSATVKTQRPRAPIEPTAIASPRVPPRGGSRVYTVL
jgi:hypothetical protein